MKPQRFLAYDPVNEEYERFDTIEDAREYLEMGFLADPNEGYHPDTEDFQIYELRETVELNIVDCIEEYENRDDWPYPEFDEICEHRFVDARKKFSFNHFYLCTFCHSEDKKIQCLQSIKCRDLRLVV